jgi:hypothetical protein
MWKYKIGKKCFAATPQHKLHDFRTLCGNAQKTKTFFPILKNENYIM